MVPVCAVNLQQLHHHPLPRLVDSSGVQHPLVAQLPEGDESLHTEELHKDACPDNRHHPGLGANAFVQEVVPVPAGAGVILPALDGHGLQPAGRRQTGLLVHTFHHIVHLGAHPPVDHAEQHLAFRQAMEVFGRVYHLLCGDDDLEVPVVEDRHGTAGAVLRPLHPLDGPGENPAGLHGLH